jgi:hypothetical protein
MSTELQTTPFHPKQATQPKTEKTLKEALHDLYKDLRDTSFPFNIVVFIVNICIAIIMIIIEAFHMPYAYCTKKTHSAIPTQDPSAHP